MKNIKLIALISAASVLRKEKIYRKLLKKAQAENLNPEKLYEALLQNYLFAGYPNALISLKIFKEYFPVPGKKLKSFTSKKLKEIGEDNCRKIYGIKYEKLISNIKQFSPELSEWLVIEGYGKVLSREGLSLEERELSVIAVLSVLKYKDQLYSHINGAVKLGVKINLIKKIISVLDELGTDSYSKFGNKVLSEYLNKSLQK